MSKAMGQEPDQPGSSEIDCAHSYMMGVSIGQNAGHFCRQDGPTSPWGDGRDILYDWHPERDGASMPLMMVRARPSEAHEGEFVHIARNGWTLIACWDRSADRRFGSTMTFAFSEVLTGDQALALARKKWPRIFKRIETHVGCPCTVRPARPAVVHHGMRR